MDVSKARAFTLLSYPTLLLLRPISEIPTKLKIIALWEVLTSPRLSTDLRGNIALRQCNAWESLPESTMLLLQHGDNNSGGSLRLTTSAIGHTQLSVSHKATQRAQLACWLLCLKPTEEPELLTLKINMGHNGIPFSLTTDFGSLREQALASQLQERGNKLLPSSILEKTLAKADFNAFGRKNNVAALQDAITKLESQEPSDQGCESWVHSHNPTAEQADLQMRRNTGSTKLLRSFGGRACSHTIPSKRQLLPKQLEWHLRLPPATADSQQQRASTHSVCLWRKSMATLLSTVGHYFDYLLDTQQTLITELATS